MTPEPTKRYKISTAAKLMGISRRSLYYHINDNRVKDSYELHNGKMMHYIKGMEIIKYINNRFYEA